jgi:hypothetical protein
MYGIYEDGKVIAQFVAPLSVVSNVPVFVSDTLSLKRFVSKRPAQRWEIESGVEPFSNNAQNLMVNLITKGSSEAVNVIMPQNYGSAFNRVATGIGTVRGTAAAGSTQITLTVSGFSRINIPKGTFIKFQNQSKIYMTVNDMTGSGTLNIFPELRTAITSVDMAWQDDVLGTFYYDTDVVKGMQYIDGILMSIENVKLVEKL